MKDAEAILIEESLLVLEYPCAEVLEQCITAL